MGRAAFRVCCLGSALEPNSFFLSLFFFSLSEWQKAQKYKFPCQEMALNIVLGGQEDRVLANATGVCVRPSRPSVGGAGPRHRLSPAVPTARGGGGPGGSSSRLGLRSTQPPPRWPPPLFRRKGAGGHMAVASEQPGKSAPCTARVTTSGFGGGEKPRSPLCVHREGGAGCRVRDSSASRVLVSRYKGKGNTATGVSAPARKRRLSGLVFPRSPKAEPASAQRAELRNASPSLSRPQQLN